MDVVSSDSTQLYRSLNDSTVLCLVDFRGITHSTRLSIESTIGCLKSFISTCYEDLRSQSFRIIASRDDRESGIDSDLSLQSLLALCILRKEGFLHLKINLIGYSQSIVSGSNNNASSCSSGVCNEKGMECFTSAQSVSILRAVGQVFNDVYEFRIQLMKHSLMSGYQLKMTKNDQDKVSAICKLKDKMKCEWRVYASLEYMGGTTFSIKTFISTHTCGAAFVDLEKFRVSSKLVKSVVVDLVRDKPSMTPKEVIDYFRHEYKYELNYYFAHAGLCLALKDVNGDESLSYHQLEAYLAELGNVNPGSHIKLEKHNSTRQFKRVFIAFGASIQGFRFCRPFIALDGTFLKNKYKGCVMAATGINGNQGIFQLAFAIVSGEDLNNWNWFMEELKVVVGIDRKYTFISDRHPGLQAAVPHSFPNSCHSFCLYHLGCNLSSKLGSSIKKKKACIAALEKVCHSATLIEYTHNLDRFATIAGKKGVEFLSGVPADRFVDLLFPGPRYGYVCSTIAESYNRWIVQERYLPITAMIDKIRQKTMKMFSDRRDDSAKWNTRLCPLKEKLLSKRLEDGASLIGIKVQNLKWEIIDDISYIVNLEDRTCTCNMWKIEGFPCVHSLRAMKLDRSDVYSYIDGLLFSSCFQDAYAASVEPIMRPVISLSPVAEPSVLPPDCRRQPGRPKNMRIPNTGSVLKRKITCTNCNQSSRHNKRMCSSLPTLGISQVQQ